jgi:hypothetical protein
MYSNGYQHAAAAAVYGFVSLQPFPGLNAFYEMPYPVGR